MPCSVFCYPHSSEQPVGDVNSANYIMSQISEYCLKYSIYENPCRKLDSIRKTQ